MGATITLRRRLDWVDTDTAGYWHHSAFWRFAEAGEAELCRATGLTELMFGSTPRRSVEAHFHRPIYFDDEVTIVVSVDQLGRTSLTYRIHLEVDGEAVADGTLAVVLVDADGRPTPWPDEARRLLDG